jgi:hypothetical protein
MSRAFSESISPHKPIFEPRRTSGIWPNLTSAFVRTLESICRAPIADLDRYECERFEHLIESLDRAKRIRRNL